MVVLQSVYKFYQSIEHITYIQGDYKKCDETISL